MSSLTIALDWTPNTNHTPLFVAAKRNPSLNLSFISPSSDSYSISPAKRVLSGEADIALVPSESILAHQLQGKKQLVAVAALLAKDASAIVALADRNVKSPADLEGKVYASYNARFEDLLVKRLIVNGGGSTGDFKPDTPARLDIWPNLLAGKADCTWVFMPWEGLQAKRKGIELTPFQLADYGLEYGYSPVLAVERGWLEVRMNQDKLKEILAEVSSAVKYTISHPEQASDVLIDSNPTAPDLSDTAFIHESQHLVNEYFLSGSEQAWGKMDDSKWEGFTRTLGEIDEGFKKGEVDVARLFTNAYLG